MISSNPEAPTLEAQAVLLKFFVVKTRSISHNCHLLCEVSPPYSFLVQV